MTSTTNKRTFWKGIRDSLPFLAVVIPFGMLFGVVATEAGLLTYETLSFSLAVFAGAAQFTALQLMRDATPVLIVLISALAVNLRCAMYSASLTPFSGPRRCGSARLPRSSSSIRPMPCRSSSSRPSRP